MVLVNDKPAGLGLLSQGRRHFVDEHVNRKVNSMSPTFAFLVVSLLITISLIPLVSALVMDEKLFEVRLVNFWLEQEP